MPSLIVGPQSDVFPPGDDAFLAWLVNFGAVGVEGATPDPPVAWLDFTGEPGLTSIYADALAAASDPGTRTTITVAAKNVAKRDAEQAARLNAEYIQAFSKSGTFSDAAIIEYGLRPYKQRSSIPTPDTAPVVTVTRMVVGGTRIECRDPENPDGRAKPYGVAAIEEVVSFNGEAEPSTINTRMGFMIESDPSRVGSRASLRCRFMNAKGQVGPWSETIEFTVT